MRLSKLSVLVALLTFGLPGLSFAQERTNWQMGLIKSVTPVKAMMTDFHTLLVIIITLICVFVLALLAYVMVRFSAKRNPTPSKTTHNTLIEVIWVTVPVLILVLIAIPSFRLLYYMDRAEDPEMSIVVRGYQWYWGYEYPDQQIEEFASYMIPEDELQDGQLRLLAVDQPLVLPVDTTVQVLVTAGDVLHSWAMPGFGVKTDAVPGRMNETWVRIEEEGTYYGQCSEICGTGHGFMPIEVHAVSREAFDAWVLEQTAGLDLEEPPVLLTRSAPVDAPLRVAKSAR